MEIPLRMRSSIWTAAVLPVVLVASAGTTLAQTIDLQPQCPGVHANGPCSRSFDTAGNAAVVSVSTSVGAVSLQGGVLLDNAISLPADEGTIYITAGNATGLGVTTGVGFSNPLTVTFPQAINNFFLTVLNGNTIPVTFVVADNVGNSASFLLPPNTSSGASQIGFAAAGTVVTIAATTGQSTGTGLSWDFAIDHINFNKPLPSGLAPLSTTSAPPTANPAPANTSSARPSMLLFLGGLATIGFFLWRGKSRGVVSGSDVPARAGDAGERRETTHLRPTEGNLEQRQPERQVPRDDSPRRLG